MKMSSFKVGSLLRSKVKGILTSEGFLIRASKLKGESLTFNLVLQIKTLLESFLFRNSFDKQLYIDALAEIHDLLDALAGSFSITKKEIREARKEYKQLYGHYNKPIQLNHIEKLTPEKKAEMEAEANLLRSVSVAAKKAAKHSSSFDSTGVNTFFDSAYGERDVSNDDAGS